MPEQANGKTMYILTVTKALIALMLAGTVCYMLATGKPIPDGLVQIFLAIGAAYFGISTKAYYESSRVKATIRQAAQDYMRRESDDSGG